jgi:hypothetical protein
MRQWGHKCAHLHYVPQDVFARVLLSREICMRQWGHRCAHLHYVPQDLFCRVLLHRRCRLGHRDGRLPNRLVQYRRWVHLDDGRVYRVPCGDLRRRYHADDGCLLGELLGRALLSCWVHQCYRKRRLPRRLVQYRRWHHIEDVHVFPVSRGDLRSYYRTANCRVLGDLHCRVLLPRRVRLRQRCHGRGLMLIAPVFERPWILLRIRGIHPLQCWILLFWWCLSTDAVCRGVLLSRRQF